MELRARPGFEPGTSRTRSKAGNPFELKHHLEISLIKHTISGSVAEGSKALDFGSSPLGGIGSIPTTASQ